MDMEPVNNEAELEVASPFEPYCGCHWKRTLNAIHDLAEIMS